VNLTQLNSESILMSFFSWLSGVSSTIKPGNTVAQGRGSGLSDALIHAGNAKTHRHARREQLYVAIREAMTHSGVLSSRYKFKVLSIDQRGDTFLVMIDLSQQEAAQTEVLPDIEKKIMVQAMARFDIAVSSVYWRHGALVIEKRQQPEFQKTVEFDDQANGTIRKAHVYKTIEFDELEAFREARLSAAKHKYSSPASDKKPSKSPVRRALVSADFEDTELIDGTPLQGLSATQYGDLN